MHRITLDHIDRDVRNSAKENLQVLCFDCNRRRQGNKITKNLNLAVIKAVFDLIDRNGEFPTDCDVAADIGITSSQLAAALGLAHKTVLNDLVSLRHKTGAQSMVHLADYVKAHGLATPW